MGQSGSYRHRIIWQHLQVTKDIYGGPSEERVDARKSWAPFEGVTGREKFKNDQTPKFLFAPVGPAVPALTRFAEELLELVE